MLEVSGIIVAGESNAAMAYVKGRRGLSPRQVKAILFACVFAIGWPLAAWMSDSWLTGLVSAEGAGIGTIAGLVLIQLVAGPAMRRALAKRGQAYEQDVTFRLSPDAISFDLGDLAMTARWSGVTDLYRTRKYWVFLVQSSAMVLPRRFFASSEAERAFVAEALSRMTEAARARSPDAVKVAGS